MPNPMVGAEKLKIRQGSKGSIIAVKVVPGSSRDRLVGVLSDCLKIAVSAPPEHGRANKAAADVLAAALGLDRRHISLVSGQTSPRKEFIVAGLSAEAIRKALAEAPGG